MSYCHIRFHSVSLSIVKRLIFELTHGGDFSFDMCKILAYSIRGRQVSLLLITSVQSANETGHEECGWAFCHVI